MPQLREPMTPAKPPLQFGLGSLLGMVLWTGAAIAADQVASDLDSFHLWGLAWVFGGAAVGALLGKTKEWTVLALLLWGLFVIGLYARFPTTFG